MAVNNHIDEKLGVSKFLSRLCGGEYFVAPVNETAEFLSRLCGGELAVTPRIASANFLSRLCGGEWRLSDFG